MISYFHRTLSLPTDSLISLYNLAAQIGRSQLWQVYNTCHVHVHVISHTIRDTSIMAPCKCGLMVDGLKIKAQWDTKKHTLGPN